MPGRRPEPTALKEIAGNPGGRRLNKNEPKAPSDDLTCPIAMSDVAQREWDRIAPLLTTMRVLSSADVVALAAYCTAFARWVDANEHVQLEGSSLTTQKGYRYPNPYLGIGNTALDQLRKFLIEFGMTPASRSKVEALPDTTPKDPMWELLHGPRNGSYVGSRQ